MDYDVITKFTNILRFSDLPSYWDYDYLVFYKETPWAYYVRLLVVMACLPYFIFFLIGQSFLVVFCRFHPSKHVRYNIDVTYMDMLYFLRDIIKTVIFPSWLRKKVEEDYLNITSEL